MAILSWTSRFRLSPVPRFFPGKIREVLLQPRDRYAKYCKACPNSLGSRIGEPRANTTAVWFPRPGKSVVLARIISRYRRRLTGRNCPRRTPPLLLCTATLQSTDSKVVLRPWASFRPLFCGSNSKSSAPSVVVISVNSRRVPSRTMGRRLVNNLQRLRPSLFDALEVLITRQSCHFVPNMPGTRHEFM